MKRKAPFFSVFPLLFWCFALHFAADAQSFDPQLLIGEWRGPDASFNGKNYSLRVVFVQDLDGSKAFVYRNMKLDKPGEPTLTQDQFYTGNNFKFLENTFSFAIYGSALTVFYEGQLAVEQQELTINFTYELPSRPDARITWKLTRFPVCNNPEELSLAARDLWADRRVSEIKTIMYKCSSLNLYEDKTSLVWGLIALKDPEERKSGYYGRWSRHSTYLFDKSISLNPQNPIAYYARAFIYHEEAIQKSVDISREIEANKKENERFPQRIWSPQLIERKKLVANGESINLLNKAITDYSTIVYNNSFERDGYVKRAQTYYALWSKYDQNDEYLKIALKDYKSAIDLDPLSYDLFYQRAKIYQALGDEEKAAKDLEKVEELKINKP